MTFPLFITLLILTATLIVMWNKLRKARRAEYIRTYSLPDGLFERLRKRRPELSLKEC